jgi:hypothetical protein
MSLTELLSVHSEVATTLPGDKQEVPDIDAKDRNNPLAETEYVNDIFKYYRRVESKYRVAPDYMSKQTDVNIKMRAILIDWLVEVHLKFKVHLWVEGWTELTSIEECIHTSKEVSDPHLRQIYTMLPTPC